MYPPKFNTRSDDKGGELSAYVLEGKGVGDAAETEAVAANGAVEPNPELQQRIDAMELPNNDPSETLESKRMIPKRITKP